MERTLLLIFVVCIFGAGLIAGVLGLQQINQANVRPSDYVLKSGECWVHPQGDPLYDNWYAEKVNTANCQAFKTQEQAKQITAITRDIKWSTTNGMIGVYSILGVVVVGLSLVVVAIIKGGAV